MRGIGGVSILTASPKERLRWLEQLITARLTLDDPDKALESLNDRIKASDTDVLTRPSDFSPSFCAGVPAPHGPLGKVLLL